MSVRSNHLALVTGSAVALPDMCYDVPAPQHHEFHYALPSDAVVWRAASWSADVETRGGWFAGLKKAIASAVGTYGWRARADIGIKPLPRFPKAAKTARILVGMAQRPSVFPRGLTFALANRNRLPIGPARFALKPFRPFGCAGWTSATKLERMLDHFRLTDALGGILKPTPGAPRWLTALPVLGDDYGITFDEPEIMMNDGLGVLSLWRGERRLFSITFILSSDNGRLVASIGGIQGRAEDGVLDIYRTMTKEAHGLRPRDLLLDIFQIVCRALGVSRILAVAADATYHSDPYFGDHPMRVVQLDYDAIWQDRGAWRVGEQWHELPVKPCRRAWDEIPPRKRALYRRRYAMMDAMETSVRDAVLSAVPGARPC